MYKRSRHPIDVSNWIIKVIESCTNFEQLICADKLIDYFEKVYKSINIDTYYVLLQNMRNACQCKFDYFSALGHHKI